MRRKLLLFVMMLVMGLGSMKANVVTIGSGTTGNSYLPTYSFYNYSLTQQIYTAAEIGQGGEIGAINFYNNGTAKTRTVTIYMKHTAKSTFSSQTDWESMSNSDAVFTGSVTFAAGTWTSIALDQNFQYDGTSNLLVCFDDNTGSYSSGLSCYVYTTNENRAIRIYSDNTNYDAQNPSQYTGTLLTVCNQLQIKFIPVSVELAMNPNPIDFGYRPSGAWMRPLTVTLSNEGRDAIISTIDTDNSFFTLNEMETPFNLNEGESYDIDITTGTAAEGAVNANMVIIYGERSVQMYAMTATAYTPVCPDVWEMAQEVTEYPYTNVPANIYDNYLLPGEEQDGPDAVYTMTFDEDMVLTASVNGENGKVALYTEDFGGEEGPSTNNNYTGPEIGNGGVSGDEFSYDFNDGTLSGWTTIDADGDGYNWRNASDVPLESGLGHGGSAYFILSQSYDNASGILYPDNYIVSPAKVLIVNGSTFSFYACAQDGGYPAEHYGVAISTEGNSNASEFTTIWEETLTAKSGNPGKGPRGSRAQGSWYLKTIDLSAYAGQEVYIAIRHFNCFDCYFLDVDDVTLTAGGGDRAIASNIDGMTVGAGTYYLAASSTTPGFEVSINATAIPAPEAAVAVFPADGQGDISTPMVMSWTLGRYTTEYQLLIGTTYPPTEVAVDWTSDLAETYRTGILLNNKNYFWRVNERNTTGTTNGQVWGFTTSLNIPQDLVAEDVNLYEGENAVLNWSSVNDRTYRGYNVYQDGVQINTSVVTATTYTVEGLAYNMGGYTFNVTAVYDEGESAYSNNVVVYVSGNGTVSGVVYEQDSITTIADATVLFRGEDEYGVEQSFTFTTGSNGAYNGTLLAGTYEASASKAGYQGDIYENEVEITYQANTADVNFVMNENYVPVGMVVAEEIDDNMVKVYWKWDGTEPMSEWLYYDDGTNEDAVGLTGGGSFYWGIMFPAATLQQYGTFSLTKVAYFDYTAHTGNILVFEGGATAPGTLIHTQAYTATGSMAFVEYDLNTALPVNTNENLWIIMNNNDGQYVASACNNTGDANGRWISLDGTTWDDVAALGLSYTWNLRGFITNQRGQVMSLTSDRVSREVAYEGKTTPDAKLASDPNAKKTFTNFGNNKVNDRSFQYYKLYRTNCYNENYTEENTLVLASHVTDTVYMDMSWADAEPGVYKWGVAVQYAGNRESRNIVTMDGKAVVAGNFGGKVELGAAPYTIVPENVTPLRAEDSEAIAALGGDDISHFTLNNPAALTSYGVTASEFTNSAAYVNGTYYYASSTSGRFGTINPATGAMTQIAAGVPYAGLAYNPVDGQMYGLALGDPAILYTVDMTTGAATQVTTCASGFVLGMAINNDGRFFVINAGIDGISELDPATGAYINNWPTGWTVNYGQDMGIDFETNTLYWAAYNATAGNAPLLTFDPETASYTTIGYFANQTSCFATMTEAPAPGPTPGGLQEPGESPITWSNCLDKDMITTLDVAVRTNSGDSPAGTAVSFVNISEPEMAIAYEVELDETGVYAWEEVRKGTYLYTISLDGYNACAEGDTIEIWDATSVECVLEEIIAQTEGLYVSPTGWAMWEGNGGIVPPTPPTPGDMVTIILEAHDVWGDGTGYQILFDADCNTTALYEGGNLTCGQSYADWEYTVPANATAGDENVVVDGTETIQIPAGTYDYIVTNPGCNSFGVLYIASNQCDETRGQSVTFEAGQTYHFTATLVSPNDCITITTGAKNFVLNNSSEANMSIAKVADPELVKNRSERNIEYYKVMLDGNFAADVENNYYQHDVTNLVEGQEYTTSVATVYSTGISEWSEYTWTYVPCENFDGVTELAGEASGADALLSWTMPNGTTPPTPPTPGENATIILEAHDVWGDGTGYQILFDADCNTTALYEGGNLTCGQSYADWEYTVPANATAGDENVVVNGTETIEIPAGTYDYIVTNPGCNSFGVLYIASNQCDETRGQSVTFEAGQTYHFTATLVSPNDCITITTGAKNFVLNNNGGEANMAAAKVADPEMANRAMWDLVSTLTLNGAGEQGIATDGNFIYTSSWSGNPGYDFAKYNMDGSFVEGFNISGVTGIRDLAYDGTFFYGGSGASTLYTLDLANKALVNTVNTTCSAIRHCSYDEANNGFWVGNWTDLKLIDATGATMATGAAPQSAYGSAYFMDENNEAHLYLFCQPNSDAKVYDYNITTNTMSSSPVFDFASTPGYNAGISGGAFVGQFDGKTCFFGNMQQDPNLVGIYELAAGGPVPPTPPTPVGGILGAMIFRDGELITPTPITETTYTDVAPGEGEHEYCVRVVYGEEEFGENWYSMSCAECVNVTTGGASCPAPEDLYGEYTWNDGGTYGATLTWPYEAPVGPVAEWLYYDNGTNEDAVGLTGGGSFYWGIMIPASSLSAYAGTSLTKVSYFDYTAHTGNIMIYQGGASAPGTLIHQQAYTATASMQFVEYALSSALPIDVTQNLWIVMNNNDGDFVASACANTGDPNGRWISLDGSAWQDVVDAGLSYTWMIRGFVTNQAKGGEIVALEAPALNGTPEGTLANAGMGYGKAEMAFAAEIDHFNVYRSTTNGDYALIGEAPANASTYYDDRTGEPGTYYYQVTAVYTDGCESAPANSYLDPEDNYVTVIVTSVEENGIENARIYPNPTNDKLNIEVADMTRITVTTVLGQVMYDQEVSSSSEIIDMSQYGAGVYMVRIVTNNGSMVKRIMVNE